MNVEEGEVDPSNSQTQFVTCVFALHAPVPIDGMHFIGICLKRGIDRVFGQGRWLRPRQASHGCFNAR